MQTNVLQMPLFTNNDNHAVQYAVALWLAKAIQQPGVVFKLFKLDTSENGLKLSDIYQALGGEHSSQQGFTVYDVIDLANDTQRRIKNKQIRFESPMESEIQQLAQQHSLNETEINLLRFVMIVEQQPLLKAFLEMIQVGHNTPATKIFAEILELNAFKVAQALQKDSSLMESGLLKCSFSETRLSEVLKIEPQVCTIRSINLEML